MLVEDHIFSIKTKDATNVADIKNGSTGIVITGLNVLREQIKIGDFVFVVFGGDKPKDWIPGLVALAHISKEPFVVAADAGRNFRVKIDVDLYFQPAIVRADLVTYPDTFGTIGIGPITKWEPNQAITSVLKRNAIGLLQAICDMMPSHISRVREILGADFRLIDSPVRRYKEALSQLGAPQKFREDVEPGNILAIALECFRAGRDKVKAPAGWNTFDEWAKAARVAFACANAGTLASQNDYIEFTHKFVYNPTVANSYFRDHGAEARAAIGNFISENRVSPKAASWYLEKENLPKVKGFGVGCALNFMMKVCPAEFATYSTMIDEALMSVGLLAKPFPTDPTVESYEQNKAKQCQVLAKMKEMGIGKAADDSSDADYLTVNEFLWFVNENQDLIKEKVMANEFKKVTRKPKTDGKKKLSDMMKDDLLKRLAAALRTKPFAILAGHSGTGKSQMVRRLAYMTCADDGLMAEAKEKNAPGNYCMIQVCPNWHDSTDLLGYYSEMSGKFRSTPFVNFVAKAYAYPEIPFFVCLDEMHLAPVEQYFAEYLSAVESASDKSGQRLTDPLVPKTYAADEVIDDAEVRFNESKAWYETHGLTLPKNLFVVGTVNMDDTTCQFSRKVLDRAMTIMMDKVAFEDMMDASKSVEPSEDDLLEPGDIAQFLGGALRAQPLDVNQVNLLKAVDKVLGKTPFAVAYRFANEYALYEASLIALTGVGKSEETSKAALDHCVLMKVLPRIHGERKEMELLFRGKPDSVNTGLEGVLDKATTLSGKKMEEILDRKSGYLSFWP